MIRIREILSKCLIVVAMISGFFTLEFISEWRQMGYFAGTALVSIVLAYFLIPTDPTPPASDPSNAANAEAHTGARSESRGRNAS